MIIIKRVCGKYMVTMETTRYCHNGKYYKWTYESIGSIRFKTYRKAMNFARTLYSTRGDRLPLV